MAEWAWLGPAPWPAWEGPGGELVASGRNAVLEGGGGGRRCACICRQLGLGGDYHVVWAPGKSRTFPEEAGG